ncbi:hypothetical protein J6590_042774 [Homalodisca vitripennis]|nr:hypothetical protein J6590_042774 [Homalodisca vitripennis]
MFDLDKLKSLQLVCLTSPTTSMPRFNSSTVDALDEDRESRGVDAGGLMSARGRRVDDSL